MKSTILLTAVTILAFNINNGYKKSARLHLPNIGTYLRAIAAKDKAMISGGSFVADEGTFVSHAIKANMQEIMMAQMASQKSTNPQIKVLVQHLINDHQQLLQELERLNNNLSQANNNA
jgi:predicted outer membrane protein